ncbi:hypothetical protein OU798_10545 [Prolixibacteraceae bacterium Z1-6]|uniref:Uncharacterized protein n=1 Tax=Draconibacterium aestuarii TaxID=2998507 RepID=A0A9X3FD49_9BACT|nr:hypothetical protein [Prolixibacteraceae bacterium Z1-6]
MKNLLLILFLVPIAFSGWSQNSFTQGAGKTYNIRMNAGKETGATYVWMVTPEEGTSTNLGAVSGNSANVVWDGPAGYYTLSVQVNDGNGCLSEPITQEVEILAPGSLIFDAVYPNTTICSDLSGGVEGSDPANSESIFRIAYTGNANLTSAVVTIKNPDGDFIDLNGYVLSDQNNPGITTANDGADKEIDFVAADRWENSGTTNAVFEITLVSAKTADGAVLSAVPSADIKRTISVLTKPAIQFN